MASHVLTYYAAAHLVKTELNYEFQIRGVATNAVELMRRQFMSLLDDFPPQSIESTDLDPDQEYNECSIRLSCLQELLEQFLENKTRLLYKRVCTKTTHLFYRVSRIVYAQTERRNPLDSLKEEIAEVVKVLEECADIARGPSPCLLRPEVEQTVNAVPENSEFSTQGPSAGRLFVPVVEPGFVSHPSTSRSEVSRPRPDSVFVDVPSPSVTFDPKPKKEQFIRNMVPVNGDFDVTFDRVLKPLSVGFVYDGSTCVVEFLERLEENRLSRNISDARLLKSACELFQKQALSWYRARAERMTSWKQLVAELRSDFGSLNYDRELLSFIRGRIQTPDERMHIFVSVMLNLFKRLSRLLSAEEQLEIILSNITTFYHQHFMLLEINSIEELLRLSKKLENAQQRLNVTKAAARAQPKSKSSGEKVVTVNESLNECAVDEVQVERRLKDVKVSPAGSSNRGGFNRGGFSQGNSYSSNFNRGASSSSRGSRGGLHHGHSKYCYRCGLFNYTVATCPRCSKNNSTNNSQSAEPKNLKDGAE